MASVAPVSWSQQSVPTPRKGRIRQSVSRWCYKDIPLDQLCAYAAQIGCKAIDLLNPDKYEVPPRYGLVCAMAYAGGGELTSAMNRVENHARIEEGFRKYIPLAAKAGVANVITFSGNRNGMSDDEGAKNAIAGLNRVKKIAEDHGVTICMELLNSKVDHHDYMCDHTAWGRPSRPGRQFPPRQASLRHLPHANHGRRSRPHHPEKYRLDRPLPHRRRPRPPRARRHPGSPMGWRDARHRRHQLPRLRRPRVRALARPLTSLRQAVDLCDV